MLKYIITLIYLYSSIASSHESFNSIANDESASIKSDSYTCPTDSNNESCKLICATPGNPNHFVKSHIKQLRIYFNENKAINVKGQTSVTTETEKMFYGYFTEKTNCMVFDMDLNK
jgi:hypothetical protein